MEDLKPVTILLVEDDPGDQKLIKLSLERQRISNDVFVTETGEEALDYLSRSKAGDSECPPIDLILLDLNMPGMGGKEFLRRIKQDEQLDTIPVVILTTSDSEQDILESYKLHAAGYIKKPVSLEGFREVIHDLEEYWFVICKLVREARTKA
jgi:CheY-like chemotaxis protein